MFSISRHRGRPVSRKKRILFFAVALLSLITLIALGMTNLLVAHAGQIGRQTINTMGDKDDLPNAPSAPITCSRAANGHGVIQGTIVDTTTNQPVANAYIGVSPGLVNSFACYTYSGTDGSFKIGKLPAGTYNLSASRWKVNGTDPLYRDSIIRQIPVGNSVATVKVALTPLNAPGYRVIGNGDSQNLIVIDVDETYFNSWFTDKNSVADPKVTPAVHGLAKGGVLATEDWTQYGYSPIDHYQLATGGFPVWRTPDQPASYWTQPDPNLDVNLWYSGGVTSAEEFGQESIFDVAKSYGMNTAIIGGNDYPAGHITNANVDQIHLVDPNPCQAPLGEVGSIENFINAHNSNPNGFLVYFPLTQAEGFNTENTSPDAPPSITSCSSTNGWTYTQASIWDDQAIAALLGYMKKNSLLQNTTIILTADEAENDRTNFDNFYPTQPGEPGLGSTRHIPFVMSGPDIKQGVTIHSQLRIDDTSVNAMASLGLPAPADSRGRYISGLFQTPPQVPISPVHKQPIPSQGFIPLVENSVNGYSTVIHAQNESTAPTTQASIVVYDSHGNIVLNKPDNAPIMPNGDWVIDARSLGLPAGFVGTALLKADGPLAIVSTATPHSSNSPPESVEGYTAAEVGSTLYAPVMLNNVNGVTSSIAITNLAPCKCPTTATANFYNASGTLVATGSGRLGSHAQLVINIGDIAKSTSGQTLSAIVTSNVAEPMGATVFNTTGSGRSFSYNALSSGDTSTTSALVENGVSGATTSLTLQNTTGKKANITITYHDLNGNVAATQTLSLVARGSMTESAANAGLPAAFTGSALIAADQKVAAISRVTAGSVVSAYNVVRNLDYSLFTSVYLPQVENNVGGVTSSVTVTNTGTSTTTAQIQYYNNDGAIVGNVPTASLAPGASYTFNQGDAASGLANGYVGPSYVSTSPAQHLAITVSFSGNNLMWTYNGSQAQTGQLILTIGQMRQNYLTFTGEVVTVQNAIVTRNFGSNWFIQDSTSGIRIYVGGGVNEQIGDVETVTGVLTDYNGEIEIDPLSASGVTKTGTGTVPSPIVITTQQIAQLSYTNLIDGELVTVPKSTITTYNPPTLGLTDSSNVEGTAYFDSYALGNINLSNFSQGEQVVTTGVLAMYGFSIGSGTGEIEPLLTSDFVPFT